MAQILGTKRSAPGREKPGKAARAEAGGIAAIPLSPMAGDFNDDLCRVGARALLAHVSPQLLPGHEARFAGNAV